MPTIIQSDKLATSYLGAAATFGLEVPAYLTGYTFAAAYSVRQLLQSYAGPCMRVRNATNSAEADVAFDGYQVRTSSVVTITAAGSSGYSLGQTMTLATFASTNDVRVTTWYDQSGNGRNAANSTAGYQPWLMVAGVMNTENSIPVVDFSTCDGVLLAAYSRAAARSMVVALRTSTATAQADVVAGYNNSHKILSSYTPTPNRLIYNGALLGDTTNDANVQRVYAARFNGASSLLYADGVQIASGAAGSNTTTDIRIGGTADTLGYNHRIWEVLDIENVTDDLQVLSQKVMAFYGLD